jgi:hypothetical protein
VPGAAAAGPLFETPASLCEGNGICVVATAESLSGVGSIAHDTFATFVKNVPGGDAGPVWKTIVNVAEVPDVIVASTQLTFPLTAPDAGMVHVKGVPIVWFSETNDIPLGTPSVRVAFGASSGPLLVTVTV